MKKILKLLFQLIRSHSRLRHSFVMHLVVVLPTLIVSPLILAATGQNPTWPREQLTGLWEQYDDDTKQLSSLVRLVQLPDGHFEGVVEKIIPGPDEDPDPKCTKCEGVRKNQRVLGMRIITNLRRTDIARYEKGEILDPDSGDSYRLRISVIESGQKLEVRGYLGLSFFGRSQIWLRAMNQVGASKN